MDACVRFIFLLTWSVCLFYEAGSPTSLLEWVGISLKSVKTVAQSKTLNNVKFFTLYATWLPLKPYLAAPAGCCTQAIFTSIIFTETMAKWSTKWVHGREASQAWGWGDSHVLNWTWLLSGTKKDVQWGGGQSGKRMGGPWGHLHGGKTWIWYVLPRQHIILELISQPLKPPTPRSCTLQGVPLCSKGFVSSLWLTWSIIFTFESNINSIQIYEI